MIPNTYRVTWSEEDGEYVSLSWLASTPEAALAGIRQVVAEVVANLVGLMVGYVQPLYA